MMYRTSRASLFAAVLFLGSSLLFTGCKSAPKQTAGVRNSDGSITNPDGSITYPAGTAPAAAQPPAPQPRLNADGSTTNPDGSVTYPAGSRHATRENEPARASQQSQPYRETQQAQQTQQAPPPPAARPVEERIIPSGTTVRITTTETLRASQNEVGDSFHGVLSQPIRVHDQEFFHQGTPVTGTVIASKRKGRFKGAGDLGIELTSIGNVHVSTSEFEAVAKGEGKRSGALIGGGGGLGAIIGGIAGGGKGALIGGLAGAGAGTAGAAYTGNRDVIIQPETPIAFTLTAPVTLH